MLRVTHEQGCLEKAEVAEICCVTRPWSVNLYETITETLALLNITQWLISLKVCLRAFLCPKTDSRHEWVKDSNKKVLFYVF